MIFCVAEMIAVSSDNKLIIIRALGCARTHHRVGSECKLTFFQTRKLICAIEYYAYRLCHEKGEPTYMYTKPARTRSKTRLLS